MASARTVVCSFRLLPEEVEKLDRVASARGRGETRNDLVRLLITRLADAPAGPGTPGASPPTDAPEAAGARRDRDGRRASRPGDATAPATGTPRPAPLRGSGVCPHGVAAGRSCLSCARGRS